MVGPVTPQRAAPAGLGQVFVGRTGELQTLRANLGWAGAGEPRVVVVTGASGIGKSALLRTFLAQCGAQIPSLTARAEEVGAGRAFGVLNQLVAGAATGAANLGASTDPLDAGALLLDVLGPLQEAGPVVVAVDDLQWVDSPSLQALTFALRRLVTDRVMALIARHDGPPPEPDGVRQLAAARGQYLHLKGLDAVALAELAVRNGSGRLAVAAAERLCQHTAGNPLHAWALLEQLDPDELRRSAPLSAPRSYPAAVLSRLERCAPATQALVTAAAVLGERCSAPTAARLAGLDDPAGALEEAVAAHLFVGDDLPAGRSLRFGHPSTRAAVYDDLDPQRRIALHTRAAAITAGVTALEHRVSASPGEDADLSRELADLAAAEVAADDWTAAAGHLETAARLEPDVTARHRLLLRAAENRLRAGENARAEDLLAQVPGDSPGPRYLGGRLALASGRLDEAGRLLEASWESDGDLAAPVATHLGLLALVQARPDDAVAWARRALESGGGDARGRSAALSVVTVGLALGGRGQEALGWLDDSARATSGVIAAGTRWLTTRGLVRSLAEDLDSARADLAGASSVRGEGLMSWRVGALAGLARTEYLLGDWDGSVGHAQLAVSLAEDAPHRAVLALCHSVATLALAARGDWERAAAHATATAMAAADSGTALDHHLAADAAAQVAFARADPVGVVTAVEPIIEMGEGERSGEPSWAWRERYADALVSLGRLDEAGALLVDLAAMAAAGGWHSSLAGAARVRGRLEASRGDLEAAESAFEEALEHLEGVPTPFSRALVEDAHGRQLRRIGQRRAAAAHLRSARACFADLGARPFLERCDRELLACGVPSPSRTGLPPVFLTPEELGAAVVAVSGRSMEELAGELVRSTHSAEDLMGQVYAKLGVSSPDHLAAALAGRHLG